MESLTFFDPVYSQKFVLGSKWGARAKNWNLARPNRSRKLPRDAENPDRDDATDADVRDLVERHLPADCRERDIDSTLRRRNCEIKQRGSQRKISPSVSTAFVALGLATAIVALSVVPSSLRPETGLPHGIEHFVIYLATGLAFAFGCELKPGLLATLLVFFSGAVAIAQLFVPGRHARLSDFIVDGLAITVGVMAVSLVAQIGQRVDALSFRTARNNLNVRRK